MAKQEVSPVAKQLWGLGIAFGVVSILFGVLALFWPGLTVSLFVLLFGVFVLIWGILGLITSISTISTDKFWWLELIFSLLACRYLINYIGKRHFRKRVFLQCQLCNGIGSMLANVLLDFGL